MKEIQKDDPQVDLKRKRMVNDIGDENTES